MMIEWCEVVAVVGVVRLLVLVDDDDYDYY